MKNIQNLIKNKPVEYVEGMNHLYSNGPKPKGDTIQQLLDLKEWSQNPERYERRLNFRAGQAKKKEQAEALKNSKKWINNPKKLEAFIKSEDPVPRNAKEKKQIKVVKKPKPKPIPLELDWHLAPWYDFPKDDDWLEEPEEPYPWNEDISIPIEEKIRRFAQAKQNDIEQVGVASLMRLKKFVG